jgi:alkylation response protein AidB-like acyl-CoA dehydrogenase
VTDVLGKAGRAFEYLEDNLAQERLAIALDSVALATSALEQTVRYVRERSAFGKFISDFQNTKFVLAECTAELLAAQAMYDAALVAHDAGELLGVDAASVKLFCSETTGRIVDRCLQLFGGYGYMLEYPISRMYADARVLRIYGGTSEIMKVIIARSLKL